MYEIYPTTFVMFVAPPGVATKSTTAGYGLKIINRMNEELGTITSPAYVNIGPTSGSPQSILKAMSETLDGSMTVISGEFGRLVSTMTDDMYDFLTHMFDADETAKKMVHTTISRKKETVINPSLSLLGCTTPAWMAENSGYMTGGGFAARTLFLFEKKKRQRRLFYKGVGPSVERLDELEYELAHDLAMIGRLKGEMEPESEGLAVEMEDWYQDEENNFQAQRGTETFQQRKHVHVLRTSMILSLADDDEMVVKREHFVRAKGLVEYVESKLSEGLSVIGKNPYSALLYKVLDFIEQKQPVDRYKIMAQFWQDLGGENPDRALDTILDVLGSTGEVQRVKTGEKTSYRIKR